MKVLFVMPNIGAWATHGEHRAPNQYYAQLAAYLREKKISEVSVIDGRADNLSKDQILEKVKNYNPDLVVLGEILHSTGGLAVIWHFNEIAKAIKGMMPNIKIAVGGLWYSSIYKETLEGHSYIDFVMIGEAELTLEELVKALEDKKTDFSGINGLASRKGNQIIAGKHRELIRDINILPMPAYDLFPMDKYVGHTYWKPFAELSTSRGCPGGCSFCYEWSQYDPRSPRDFLSWRSKKGNKIVDELEYLEKEFGIKVVVFQDDAFNVDKNMVIETCNEILRRRLAIKWVILGRADDWVKQIDIFGLMKKAGLFMGLVGIEVSSDDELKRIGKGITVNQIKQTIEELRKNDIATVGTILIGLEDDSEARIKDRFNFAEEADPDILAIDFVTPVPGSPVWKKALKQKLFDPQKIDLKTWDFLHPVIPTNHLSVEELGRLGAWCMREFFSKASRIHRIMESNYSDLVKLCVKDFMNNISKFEASATKGELYV
ncbi:MAG: radical SAM protein [Candidatus Omnitrophota bacterium]